MSLRISEALAAGIACVLLASCGSGAEAPAADMVAQASADPDDGKADCAIGPGAGWARSCLVERSDGPDGAIVTLRHPDGGFRRFRVVTDGRGLVPADGAEAAKIALLDDRRIELTVGEDRYRLPATLKQPRP
ncbi:MAG: hypothetical protein ABW039_11975 [Sphingobium sp.]